jgi:hypothetical protein
LEYFVNHFKVTGQVGTLETARKIDIYIKIGDEDDGTFLLAVDFHQFFHILYTDTG